MEKVCKKCNNTKDLLSFYKNAKMKDGHLNICKDCSRLETKSYRSKDHIKQKAKETRKKYTELNRDIIKEYSKKYHKSYYTLNKEEILIYQSNYRKDNLEAKKEYEKNYRKNNKLKRKEYHQNRIKYDQLYKLSIDMRSMVNKSFIRKNFIKNSKTEEIIGCSFEELKLHLESKFEIWMTWENKGLYNGEFRHGWDIDHIIPLSMAKNENEMAKLNHYTNLQPLCSKINREIKRDN